MGLSCPRAATALVAIAVLASLVAPGCAAGDESAGTASAVVVRDRDDRSKDGDDGLSRRPGLDLAGKAHGAGKAASGTFKLAAAPGTASALTGRVVPRRAHGDELDSLLGGALGTESYEDHGVNPWVDTGTDRFSTFAIDVDTASYTITRRKIMDGVIPPAEAVRVEELINYFKYDYAGPGGAMPFAVHMEAAPSPFTPGRHLLRVALQGKKLSKGERKPAHLVFLVDTSGSMRSPDKLDLAKRSLRILVDNLQDGDTVALTTYAGSVRLVLEPTGIDEKARIHAAIESLSGGGSTAMGSGIELAYSVAARTLSPGSLSRVIVLSDGDANVGPVSHDEILKTIRGKVSEGVTLSVVGFGMGNYKDALMESLADSGNGNYYYVDGLSEARRIFQEALGGTLEVIAKDVKIQVELNPAMVSHYRLIGYENRDIADDDFRDDKVDAGELGAGHRVTAVFEVELTPEALKASSKKIATLATVRLRHMKPKGTVAVENTYTFPAAGLNRKFDDASRDFRFAAAVAGAGEILRRSPHAEGWDLEEVIAIAGAATEPHESDRKEFLALMNAARELKLPPIAAR